MLQRKFDPSSLIDHCSLQVGSLIPDVTERRAFFLRFEQFIDSDDFLQRVIHVDGEEVQFESESFLPSKPASKKPNLVFVVGNPAPESIVRRAMYAYEGSGTRQHRFWKVMHTTGVLRFSEGDPDMYSPETKMERLFGGQYSSPFNFHVVPFFSMPSPPGGSWSGVAGLRRLFGKRFADLVNVELASLNTLLSERLRGGDCVLVSQKDAYMALKPEAAPAYDPAALRRAALTSHHKQLDITLACIPPTRLFYSVAVRSVLTSLVTEANKSQKKTV